MDFLITLTMKEAGRHEIAQRLIHGRITEEEARKLLGLKSVRQVRRIKNRVKKEGAKGLAHRGRGRPGNRKLSEDFTDKVMTIVKEKYGDFKPTFTAEKLRENHNMTISKETLRRLMAKEGLWKPKSRKQHGGRHVWRARKENYGEMQQFDGSYHLWLEDRGEEACLLLAIDDATGRVTKAKFDKNEGTIAVFGFWLEYFDENGLPVSIYLDKFSTYKINHPAAADDKDLLTQFQRAMDQVGVKPISAHSPEAKGRVERVFQTLQDRLVKELRLAGVSTIGEANEFLKTYIPKFNAQFAVAPAAQADLHRGVSKELKAKLPQIFSIQSQRKVNGDYTVLFKNKFFQLSEKQPVTVYKKDTVTVEVHLDGGIRISHKNRYLEYQELPKRPEKMINILVPALTAYKSGYVPPAGHPWRGNKYLNKKAHFPSVLITSK
jgi:transposase